MKVKVISLPYIFQVLYVLCFTEPRYQVSVYRTIGPLVIVKSLFTLILNKLMETPLFVHWGGQQGGVMSQIMYTEDINKG